MCRRQLESKFHTDRSKLAKATDFKLPVGHDEQPATKKRRCTGNRYDAGQHLNSLAKASSGHTTNAVDDATSTCTSQPDDMETENEDDADEVDNVCDDDDDTSIDDTESNKENEEDEISFEQALASMPMPE